MAGKIKGKAEELGFDACGIARAGRLDVSAKNLKKWLDKGLNAGLGYMENHFEKRVDPRLLVDGAKTVIVCLISYKRRPDEDNGNPKVASYACFPDYHYTVKSKLGELLDFIKEVFPGSEGRVFTDSAPVSERAWAVEAGLGWIGCNSMLINPLLGSFTIIGTVITDAAVGEYDAPYTENHCAGCGKCIAGCPTGAMRGDKTIDAAKCISYQTIENRGEIPSDVAGKLNGWVFGCDICQDVCPHNASVHVKRHDIFSPIADFSRIAAEEWLAMGSGEFKRRFGNTPLSRCGLRKIKATVKSITLKSDGSAAPE